MRFAPALPAALLLTAACNTVEPTATTVSAPAVTTTTGAQVSTTNLASVTTTSSTPTTLVEGNWAEVAVITSSVANRTLGWWDGSNWVQAEDGMDLPVSGGEDYQVALLGSDGVSTTGGARITGCDIYDPDIDFPGIELADPDLLWAPLDGDQEWRGGLSGLAISAPWDIQPRPASTGESSPDLEYAAISLLADRGFSTDSVVLAQVVESDIDGDGSLETFVVTESTELANEASGVYSVLFATSPAWSAPRIIAESVIPPTEQSFPASFRISAVADLNGDGTMELVVDGLAWENSWVDVYEPTDDGFVVRIGAACGV
ncbi:MAG: hypothetical protein WAL25_01760 [Acidimicrobiia bacterium]